MAIRPHDVLQLAVNAAGGTKVVAELFDMTPQNVTHHIRSRTWGAHLIRPLCEAGKNIITPDQVLEYLEAARADERQQAEVVVSNGR